MGTTIYYLCDTSGHIRYVGMTVGRLRDRLHGHLSKARKGRVSHLYCWVRSMLANKETPTIHPLDYTEGDGGDLEITWIAKMREGGCRLTNFSDGGESVRLGKPHTEETKQKIRLARLGKKHSEATRAKLTAMNRRRGITPEQRTKMIEGRRRTSKPMSAETKAKISAANSIANAHNARAVDCYTLGGAFLRRYKSVRGAAKATGAASPNIRRACKSGASSSVGFRWRYANAS